jgi:hypothetical protein
LKPENILLTVDTDSDEIDFKIIDMGSSFPISKVSQLVELTTPEYLPPDILEYLESK